MHDRQKPPRLADGATVAIVSLSSTATTPFEHRLDAAIDFLRDRGYQIKEFPETRHDGSWTLEESTRRAEILNSAFADPSVDLIMPAIGGFTANTLLSDLSFDDLRANPKAVCGYSDITSIHYGILSQSDLVTFYGPCAITEFGEYPAPFKYTIERFAAVFRGEGLCRVEPAPKWTDEVLDWTHQLDTERRRERFDNSGYEWLREGVAEGPLLGGCLPTLSRLVGTDFWPDHEGAILLLDIPEGGSVGEHISVSEAHSALAHLKTAGVFSAVSGVIISRPPHIPASVQTDLKRLFSSVTTTPVVYGVDCGHTDPQATFPLGTRFRLDSKSGLIKSLEPGVC